MCLCGKKGYMRTLEAFLAFIITFTSLIIILDQPAFVKQEDTTNKLLENLVLDDDFRDGIFGIVGSCVDENSNLLVANMTKDLLEGYSFYLCNDDKPTLPKKNVYVDSAVISGNMTELLDEPYIRLYYWK